MVLSQSLSFTSLFLLFHPEDAYQQYQGKCPLFSQSKEKDLCSSSRCNSQRISALSTAAAAKSRQTCPTPCDPIDSSPPGSAAPGILQARTLEWVAISFSSAWKWKVKVKLLIRVQLLATPWTVAHPAPPSMGFSRQEYWSGVPLPSSVLLCLACPK